MGWGKKIDEAKSIAIMTKKAIVTAIQPPRSIFVITSFSKPIPRDGEDLNLSRFAMVLDNHLVKYQRTFGYFFSLEEAKKTVEENSSVIFEEVYELVAIEEIKPGVYRKAEVVAWYKWESDKDNPRDGEFSNGKYVPTTAPSFARYVTNFAMG